ncbi:AAA family ATPase [Pyrococcus abyssi]|uniref:Archaeal ATPase n=1 Tax=Pyrococcus abyssi (strain GE5 / Orsay) TaxID=272844 RepID=Q9V004_PYRAB|nr:ATP-binding protein [Pyrococcus abyssi]CAB49902.1 Hypothetical protein, contains DUF238 domain [Pyrococcus abyssi GE5]CCE70400.1 TPA: Archaeal ATPase [Pyrococcus abyssi GE5]
MLFDPRPKEKREDIFDREKEIDEIESAIRDYPITLILGIRRVGKSSLLKAVLNEMEGGIYIDVRKLYFESGGWITNVHLAKALEEAINSLKEPFKRILISSLKSIEGISVSGVKVRFTHRVSLSSLLERLNEQGEVILAFDEAQYLKFYGKSGRKEFLAMVAYAYDNLPNVSFVFTGSEVGLLHDFVGVSDYDSPIYGRVYREVTIEPFSRETSISFLRAGFEEAGVEVKEEEIKEAVDVLGGIPGWLVEFGYHYVKLGSFEEAMRMVLKRAEELVKGELEELKKRSPRYVLVLKAISLGFNRWKSIKEFVEARSGRIPNSRLASILENLQNMSWIRPVFEDNEKRYKILDPVVERIIKEL